jgi:hypothetical protein
MVSPYAERRAYVNSAVAICPIEVPCELFKEKSDFWKAAKYVAGLWDEIKVKKQMAKTVEEDAGKFIESWVKRRLVLVLIHSNFLLLTEADNICQHRSHRPTRQTTNLPLFRLRPPRISSPQPLIPRL